jgi:hypothetical protein
MASRLECRQTVSNAPRSCARDARISTSVIEQLPYDTLKAIETELIAFTFNTFAYGPFAQRFSPMANFVVCCCRFKMLRPVIWMSHVGSIATAKNLVVGSLRYRFEFIYLHACELACMRILESMPLHEICIPRQLNQQELELLCSFSKQLERLCVTFDYTVRDLSCLTCMGQMKTLSISDFHGESLSALKHHQMLTSLVIKGSPQITDLIEVILTLPLLESLIVDNDMENFPQELRNTDIWSEIEDTRGCYRMKIFHIQECTKRK